MTKNPSSQSPNPHRPQDRKSPLVRQAVNGHPPSNNKKLPRKTPRILIQLNNPPLPPQRNAKPPKTTTTMVPRPRNPIAKQSNPHLNRIQKRKILTTYLISS